MQRASTPCVALSRAFSEEGNQVQHDDLELKYWGDQLTTWPKEWTDHVNLPDAARDYLHNVGLPAGQDWNLEILPASQPVRIRDGLVELIHDGPVPLCVDEENGGRVVAVEEEGARERLVNSDVVCLGRFLMLYQQYRVAVRNVSGDEAETLIASTLTAMQSADPSAMSQKDNYWMVIVEQMRDGLL